MSTPQKPTVQFRVRKFAEGMAYVEWVVTDELGTYYPERMGSAGRTFSPVTHLSSNARGFGRIR